MRDLDAGDGGEARGELLAVRRARIAAVAVLADGRDAAITLVFAVLRLAAGGAATGANIFLQGTVNADDATANDRTLTIAIADDGVGGASPAGGSGLRGLADRVEALDGRLRVVSPPGGGTVVTAELPCGS